MHISIQSFHIRRPPPHCSSSSQYQENTCINICASLETPPQELCDEICQSYPTSQACQGYCAKPTLSSASTSICQHICNQHPNSQTCTRYCISHPKDPICLTVCEEHQNCVGYCNESSLDHESLCQNACASELANQNVQNTCQTYCQTRKDTTSICNQACISAPGSATCELYCGGALAKSSQKGSLPSFCCNRCAGTFIDTWCNNDACPTS